MEFFRLLGILAMPAFVGGAVVLVVASQRRANAAARAEYAPNADWWWDERSGRWQPPEQSPAAQSHGRHVQAIAIERPTGRRWSGRTIALACAIAVLLVVQLAGLGSRLIGTKAVASGPASELARGSRPAPEMDPSSLVVDTAPPGFEPTMNGVLPLDQLGNSSANPDVSRANLVSLGYKTGYQRIWRNPGIHQSIVVAVSEFGSPGAAALHKIQVARTWATQNRPRFPVPEIAGAIAAQHTLTLPGKYPEAEDTVAFRVERWEFSLFVGNAVGPAGSVPVTVDLARQVANAELARVRSLLAEFVAPPSPAGDLRVRDAVCRCSISLPHDWDLLPIHQRLLEAGMDAVISGLPDPAGSLNTGGAARIVAQSVIAAGTDLANGGRTAALFLRVPSGRFGVDDVQSLVSSLGGGQAVPEVTDLTLPVGHAKQLSFTLPVAGLAGVTVTATAFDHEGWTYIVEVVNQDSAMDPGLPTKVLQSVRV